MCECVVSTMSFPCPGGGGGRASRSVGLCDLASPPFFPPPPSSFLPSCPPSSSLFPLHP